MNKRIKKKLRKNCVLVVDISCVPRGWKMEQWFHVVSYYGIAAYDSNICKNIKPVYTIPAKNIKGFKVIDDLNNTIEKNLKEYNERIVSV